LLRWRPIAEPLVALAFAVLASAASMTSAGAAPSEADVTQARDRFAAARKLEDAGRWAEALALFQRVAEVRMTPQVRFHVALCMENVGLWTQALDGYAQAADEAGTAAPDVVKEANEHLRKLGPTLPTVSLRVEGAAAGDELLLDRRRLPLDDRPLPFRADPGPHTAEVRRDGAVVSREYFALDAGSTRRVELRIGAIAPERGEPTPILVPGDAAPFGSPPPGRAQHAIGWTAIGVGATGIALTGVFAGLRAAAMSRLTAECPSLMQCPTTVAPIVGDGKTDAALVNVFGVLGGVATAAGVALLLTAPSASTRAPGRAAVPTAWVELDANGRIAVRGAF
jgi:hypothetical protein